MSGRVSRPWAWAGAILGAMAVSGAVVAVLNGGGSDDDNRPVVTTSGGHSRASAAPGRAHWRYEWPASYAGPVWITVDPPDDVPRTVTITWGPWQRQIVHDGDDPATYLFGKDPTRPGESTVPTSVDVDPAAVVSFGSGTPPPDAIDVNEGWTQRLTP